MDADSAAQAYPFPMPWAAYVYRYSPYTESCSGNVIGQRLTTICGSCTIGAHAVAHCLPSRVLPTSPLRELIPGSVVHACSGQGLWKIRVRGNVGIMATNIEYHSSLLHKSIELPRLGLSRGRKTTVGLWLPIGSSHRQTQYVFRTRC